MKNFLFIAVCILVAITTLQLWMTQDAPQSGDGPSVVTDSSVQIGGEFTLTDHLGRHVSDADFKGKVMLVFFGFTHCPDICPVTVSTLSKTMEQLGDDAEQVAPLFITVDPERDSPEVMKDYLAPFDPRIVGLTGSEEDIKQVQQSYKAYSARSGDDDSDGHAAHEAGDGHAGHDHAGHGDGDKDTGAEREYTMDHSSYIYVMNRKGGFEKIFPYTASEKELARAVQALLKD